MEQEHGQVQLLFPDKIHLTLHPKPFRVDVYEDGTLLSTLNAQNLLLIEPMRVKPGLVSGFGAWVFYWGGDGASLSAFWPRLAACSLVFLQ